MRFNRWAVLALAVLVGACTIDNKITNVNENHPMGPTGPTAVPVTRIDVTSDSIVLSDPNCHVSNTSFQLVWSVFPANATNKDVVFKVISNDGSITVTDSGLVKTVKAGAGTVYVAWASDTTIKKLVQVTVTNTCAPVTVAVASVKITPSGNIAMSIGLSCSKTLQLNTNVLPLNATDRSFKYSTTNRGMATVDLFGLLSVIKAGVEVVYATSNSNPAMKDSIEITVSDTSCVTLPPPCPNGFNTCTGARWSDGEMSPRDTSYEISKRRHVRGLVYIPSGMTTSILVRSVLGCEASASTPSVIATSVSNVYTVDVEMQGIAVCSDSTIFKLAADSSQRRSVHVNVVSAPGSLVLNQPATLGANGAFGNYTCTVSNMADSRCWYYSTQPLIVAIVQKDTTFAVATNPWPAGAIAGGRYKNLNIGTGNICGFSPSNPSIASCKSHTVSASVSSSSLRAEAVSQEHEWQIPEHLRNIKP